MNPHSQNIVELEKVNFNYNHQVILKNITLSIKKGDFVGIIGPNGGGKTTLLKIILKLLALRQGDISLFGQSIRSFNSWHRIGYVPQKVTQLETKFPITVQEIVSLGRVSKLGLLGRTVRKDADSIDAAIKTVDLFDNKSKLITELSGGQKQRVFIAKALASEPELLILDEPTTGVDIKSQEKFYQLLSKLNCEKGITIILVSHDIGVVINEVKTLFCINHSLVYHGSSEKFSKGNYLEKIYGKEIRFVLHEH